MKYQNLFSGKKKSICRLQKNYPECLAFKLCLNIHEISVPNVKYIARIKFFVCSYKNYGAIYGCSVEQERMTGLRTVSGSPLIKILFVSIHNRARKCSLLTKSLIWQLLKNR